jgi:hypothetical protein
MQNNYCTSNMRPWHVSRLANNIRGMRTPSDIELARRLIFGVTRQSDIGGFDEDL